MVVAHSEQAWLLRRAQVDDLVVVMDEALRDGASGVAQRLRRAGRSVDLVLEAKKMKWVFKVGALLLCIAWHAWAS